MGRVLKTDARIKYKHKTAVTFCNSRLAELRAEERRRVKRKVFTAIMRVYMFFPYHAGICTKAMWGLCQVHHFRICGKVYATAQGWCGQSTHVPASCGHVGKACLHLVCFKLTRRSCKCSANSAGKIRPQPEQTHLSTSGSGLQGSLMEDSRHL